MTSYIEFNYIKKTNSTVCTRAYKIKTDSYSEIIQDLNETERDEGIIILDKKMLIKEILK